jgi:hypothetical protein
MGAVFYLSAAVILKTKEKQAERKANRAGRVLPISLIKNALLISEGSFLAHKTM